MKSHASPPSLAARRLELRQKWQAGLITTRAYQRGIFDLCDSLVDRALPARRRCERADPAWHRGQA